MTNEEKERYYGYLRQDMNERNTVKLELHIHPWEIVGTVTFAGGDWFGIKRDEDTETEEFLLSHIQSYRLA